MTALRDLLLQVPAVYAELETAMVAGSGSAVDVPRVSGGGGNDRTAPARLDVVEHRHKLVRGLRWWVDALHDGETSLPSASSVAGMCAWLAGNLSVLAPEDRTELARNLSDWLNEAHPNTGDVPTPRLPLEALDRRVPVHVAAQALGVTVRTIRRRAPREDGTVVLRDAAGPPCDQSDLPPAWCDHCRAL